MRTLSRLLAACSVLALFPLLPAPSAGPAGAEAAPPAPAPARAPDPDYIPPAFRAERHTTAGEAYLKALPDGSRVVVDRADGAEFALTLQNGKLSVALPSSVLSEDGGTLTTPLGYTLTFLGIPQLGLVITAPGGRFTQARVAPGSFLVAESDGGTWKWALEGRALRLPDGTRLDGLDKGKRLEVLTLRGERFSAELAERRWTSLAPIPSPPLVPDKTAAYLAGDGDDWRLPFWEDDAVFAWNWVMVGLPVDRALADLREGQRRKDIELYFNEIDRVQPPEEPGGALLARRLVLSGGDRITFEVPGRPPATVFVLPGPLEADYSVPKTKVEKSLTPRVAGE